MRIVKILVFLMVVFFISCEKEFIPATVANGDKIVVEGYIEAGERALPPYVLLTRSIPFFQTLDADRLQNLFIHDAEVFVSDGEKKVQLTELCLEDLTPMQRRLAGGFLGIELDSIGFNFCVYLDLSLSLVGKEGKNYSLTVKTKDQTVSAITTIPKHVPLDSMRFIQPPGKPNDTLLQLRAFISDPKGVPNFYRYQTQINRQQLLAPINSVVDDRLFDGRSFEFPLNRAYPRRAAFDPATFGLYHRGDTITIKWINLDKAHYDFWNTLEFNAVNQGPFSSYTRISSNINGGLGIWGGLSASYYKRAVPLK